MGASPAVTDCSLTNFCNGEIWISRVHNIQSVVKSRQLRGAPV